MLSNAYGEFWPPERLFPSGTAYARAAADEQRLARDVAAVRRQQEHDRTRDLARHADPFHRNAVDHALAL